VANTDAESNGAAYATFAGRGFGTIQMQRVVGEDPVPQPVSRRAYLRRSLPAVYQEGDFGMRFVGALEHLLDPIVALLDNLPAHFDPRHAPPDVLELLTAWLGFEHDEAHRGDERRAMVRGAAKLVSRRGTRAGLELALGLAFPGLPFRVDDGGGVSWSTELDGPAAEPADRPSFVVYCDKAVPEATQAAIARLIEQSRPAHTSFRLRVKAPRSRPKEEESP
jgi:phage tail-like protein